MCATTIHPERLKTLRDIPGLMDRGGTLLYVGARLPDGLRGIQELRNAGYAVTILEIWPDNVRKLLEAGLDAVRGDVCDAARLFDGARFDVVFRWHGSEHVEKSELPRVAAGLKGISRRLPVTGCPWGRYEQGEEYGNPHERHVLHLEPENLIAAGLPHTRTYGVGDTGYPGHVTAWWRSNQERKT